MAFASNNTSMASTAAPTPSVDIPHARDASAYAAASGLATYEKQAAALLTPPNSMSPDFASSQPTAPGLQSPPAIKIADRMEEDKLADIAEVGAADPAVLQSPAVPLSKGALSGLDAAAAITPAMLAKYHLPGIMLGNGPRPIRYVMGELTQSVPGFSRIPSAKARRLVVAALESRQGGGLDGSVAFYKTGWGKWDAHIKGSVRDSAIGSFNEARLSPPRSEQSYALSHTDSAVHMHGPRLPSGYRDHSGGSWTASSIREEDELDMDMDVPENEADKMSLDGISEDEDDDSVDMDDATDDEEDWSAVGPEALRKASMAATEGPRRNYNALSASCSSRWMASYQQRRQSSIAGRMHHSTSLPQGGKLGALNPALATPEETAAIAALMSMGSM